MDGRRRELEERNKPAPPLLDVFCYGDTAWGSFIPRIAAGAGIDLYF
jgi:hypothetical protein